MRGSSCPSSTGFLKARIELDEARVRNLDPQADLPSLASALAGIPVLCGGGPAAGSMGALSVRERFHWLVAPRSSSVQTSPVHTGRCEDLDAILEHLLVRMVRPLPPT
jgi:hypothetical protein